MVTNTHKPIFKNYFRKWASPLVAVLTISTSILDILKFLTVNRVSFLSIEFSASKTEKKSKSSFLHSTSRRNLMTPILRFKMFEIFKVQNKKNNFFFCNKTFSFNRVLFLLSLDHAKILISKINCLSPVNEHSI